MSAPDTNRPDARAKSRRASSHLTLSSSLLDGYSGRVEVMTRGRQRWWERLLRRTARPRRQMLYVNVSGATARAWRYTRGAEPAEQASTATESESS